MQAKVNAPTLVSFHGMEKKQNLFSLFVFLFFWGFSELTVACRVGNYTSPQTKNNPPAAYQSVKLFMTEPSQFQTVIIYKDGTPNSINPHTPLAAIPSEVMNTFTDPVYFATPIDTSKTPQFIDQNLSHALSTAVDQNGFIKSESDSPITPLWKNQKCLTQVQQLHEGSFDHTQNVGTPVHFSDGSESKTEGRLKLKLTFIRIIDGGNTSECNEDLERLAQCEQNGNGCSSNELKAANELFDLYLNRGGVLKVENVTQIKALAYVVDFQ